MHVADVVYMFVHTCECEGSHKRMCLMQEASNTRSQQIEIEVGTTKDLTS